MTKKITNNHYPVALVMLAMTAVILLGANPALASTTFTVNSVQDTADFNVVTARASPARSSGSISAR
jgi:hypothetical protein